ncbi:MAG: hypothetical protein M5U25_21195 [Planctomycetota bacterium]|nr:hypothetical protein [Planctomycetota bacterium]
MDPQPRFAWIVFIDLVDSSAFADVLGMEEHYKQVLKPYHETAQTVFEELKAGHDSFELPKLAEMGFYSSVRGDEVIGVFPNDPAPRHSSIEERRRLMWFAMRLGLRMKMAWLTGPFNVDRVRGQRAHLDVAVGLHCGHLLWKEKRDGDGRVSEVKSPEGFALAYSKRVESAARLVGDSRFALSPEAANEATTLGLQPQLLTRVPITSLKGLSGITHVFGFGGTSAESATEAATAINALPDRGSSIRTMLANLIRGWHRHRQNQSPTPTSNPPSIEVTESEAIKDAALRRVPVLLGVSDIREPGETDWDAKPVPNALIRPMLKRRFYSVPEALRAQAAIEAVYAVDREGDWNIRAYEPMDWLVYSTEGAAKYGFDGIRNLAIAGLSEGESVDRARPHNLVSWRKPCYESYMLARIVFRIASKCQDRTRLEQFAAKLAEHLDKGDELGKASIVAVVAMIKARLASTPPATVAFSDVDPEKIRAQLDTCELGLLKAGLAVLVDREDGVAGEGEWSRPPVRVWAFGSWLAQVADDAQAAVKLLRRALARYEADFDAQKQRALSFPSCWYTAAEFERERGWLSCPVAARHELDLETGDLARVYELIPKWRDKLERLERDLTE